MKHLSKSLVRWFPVLLITFSLLFQGCDSKPQNEQQTTSAGPKQPAFDYEQIQLKNGLTVITLEDFSCPIAAVQIWYHVGSKDENPDRQGFAHMFEHMMFRGTDRLGPTDHFSLIRSVGGSANGYTSFDRTVYLQTLPAEQLDLALWLEAERMAFLRIDQESFDIERKVVEEERRMGLNQPYGTVFENLFDAVYTVHPYRWTPIGKIPHLRAAHVQELRDFWEKYYTPSNATLVIVGAVSHQQAQDAAEKYFGWIPKYNEPPRVEVVEPPIEGPRDVTLKEDNAPAPAVGVVYRSVPLAHKDAVVFRVIANILGGGNSSRLYRELVAQKQLAVAAAAENYSLQQDGLFGAGAVMPPFGANADMVLEIIESHISKLSAEPVSEQELNKAKNQLARTLVTENLRIERKARTLAGAAVDMGDLSRVNSALDEIRAVTADDCMRIAQEYLVPQRAFRVRVERNLLGSLMKSKDEQPSELAEPETETPRFGRPGVVRSDVFPSEPPIAEIKPGRITPQYDTKILKNGLKVLVVQNDEVPFITVQLGFLSGAWTEEHNGSASMALAMLTKGTQNYTEEQLAEELETYAIGLGGSVAMDTSSVNMSCLTEHVQRAMGLLGEVVLRPSFPEDEFEKLRKQVLTSLAVESASPEYLTERQFRIRLYGNHPYARTAAGEINDVNSLTVNQAKDWWTQNARPDAAVLIFAGDINSGFAFELAEKTFGQWESSGEKHKTELAQISPAEETHIYLVDRPGSTQSQIRMGHLGLTRHDEGYFVSRIVSSYFGWAFNSRLNESIRVDKGLTYSVWGGYEAGRFAGTFKIGTFTKTESTARTINAVIEEIKRLKNEPPSSDELENNRSYILGSFVKDRETPQQIASDLWLIESQQLNSDYLDRLLDSIAAAQAQDCLDMAQKSVDENKLVIIVAGDAAILEDELAKIAPVTVIASD
ncbi:MAG: pitrilysin family protein [Phycisphaerae bacterium]